MAVTPLLQADAHLQHLLMAGTPLLQADDTGTPVMRAHDTNFHEALRHEHEALAVEFPTYWQPYTEPLPVKAPPPGYDLNCPPPKWGAPHQSARQPPPIVSYFVEQSLEQLHQEFLRTQRLWLARLLDAPLDAHMTPPFKAPPTKAPPSINAPPPPSGNRWTTYPYLRHYDQWLETVDPPPAIIMTSGSSSDTDTTYNNVPPLIDDPYRRRRSRSPSTISRASSTCVPSSTSAESVASRYDGPNTSEGSVEQSMAFDVAAYRSATYTP